MNVRLVHLLRSPVAGQSGRNFCSGNYMEIPLVAMDSKGPFPLRLLLTQFWRTGSCRAETPPGKGGQAGRPPNLFAMCSVATRTVFLLALALTLTACGGGIDESLLDGIEFDLSAFETVENTGAGAGGEAEGAISAFAGIGTLNLEQGYKVAYLHDMYSLVDETRDSNRNLLQLGEDGAGGEELDVDWVISVHDSHFVSEELRFRIYSYPFTDGLSVDYVDFHADFLRGVEIYTICADRLLEGALMLDPEYDSANLTPAQRAEFLSLMRESMFYCQQAEALVTRSGEELQTQIGRLRFE